MLPEQDDPARALNQGGGVAPASDADYRLMAEAISDYAIFLLDEEGRVRSWNAGAQRFKGYVRDEVIGCHFRIFYPQALQDQQWPEHELEVAREVGRFEDEGWRVRKDGSLFWANIVITRLLDESGRPNGFSKVTRDLTDKRRISSLEDEGRRIATFLAMLGHELRNPLAPIANALAIMDSGKAQAEHLELARGVLSRQVAQMTRLVDDLLDVGRITSGKITLDLRPIDLAGVLADAVDAIELLAQAKGHQIRVEGLDGNAWANADRARMIQVVGNLLANAVKFTPAGGIITATLRRIGERVEISIRDSGVGIAEHMLTDIFRPFVQGDQDAARSQGGLGLGLSLVHQIVQLHGGDVAAFSTTLNSQGSEFVVGLPAIAPVPKAAAAPASTAAVQRDLLLVDDNQDAAHTLRIALEMLGYRVTVAHDGLTALAAAAQHKPDAMLLDLGLPGLSGIEVAKRIRASDGHQPRLVALTGYGTDEDRMATNEAGFDAHLTKPVSIDELTRLIECLVGQTGGDQASRPT